MQTNVKLVDSIKIVTLNGRFDASNAPAVRTLLEAETAAAGGQVIVNLADVPFIDSTALAALVQGMKRSRQHGGDLSICCLQQPVRIIFELTRLDKAFMLFSDEAEAIATVQGQLVA